MLMRMVKTSVKNSKQKLMMTTMLMLMMTMMTVMMTMMAVFRASVPAMIIVPCMTQAQH